MTTNRFIESLIDHLEVHENQECLVEGEEALLNEYTIRVRPGSEMDGALSSLMRNGTLPEATSLVGRKVACVVKDVKGLTFKKSYLVTDESLEPFAQVQITDDAGSENWYAFEHFLIPSE